jgi:putative membrane protein insertion efficiency factor
MMRDLGRLLGTPLRWSLIAIISAYRHTIGRMLVGRCRFHPGCSAYALEALRTHGALKGLTLATWRVLRCSPLTSGGLDPVPPAGTWRSEPVV